MEMFGGIMSLFFEEMLFKVVKIFGVGGVVGFVIGFGIGFLRFSGRCSRKCKDILVDG